MQFNYQTQQLLDKGVNFATIYPEKQGVVKEMTGFDFDLQNIVSFLQKETDNFTIVLPLALEIDKNIVSIYNKYQTSQGKKSESKPEAKEDMIFTVEDKDGNIKHTGKSLNGASDFYSIHKDEGYEIFVKEGDKPKRKLSGTPDAATKPSVEILTGRLKLIKKMYAKTPSVVLKGRIKIIEKMLTQPEKFCCGDRLDTGGGVSIQEGDIVTVKSTDFKGEVTNVGTEFITIEFIGERPVGGDKRGTFNSSQLEIVNEEYSTGGEVETEFKRLNAELSKTERGTPERMEVLGKINMLKHQNPSFKPRLFARGGKAEKTKNEKNVYEVTGINYDTDGDNVNLPETLTIVIPENLTKGDEIENYISEEISNRTGYCHLGFNTTPEIPRLEGGGKPEKVCSLQNRPKIYNYKGVKVKIKPASKTSKKYIVWDVKSDQIFANEKFDSIDDAKAFVKENKMKIVK